MHSMKPGVDAPAAAPAATSNTPTDILFISLPGHCACYRGTRAALTAENVVHPAVTWPAGDEVVQWQDDTYRYQLYRAKPERVKGQQRQQRADWWQVVWVPLRQNADSKRAAQLRATPPDTVESFRHRRAIATAHAVHVQPDRTFRAFMKRVLKGAQL